MRADEWIARPVVSVVAALCIGIAAVLALAGIVPRDMIRGTNIAVVRDGSAWLAVDLTDRSWGPEHRSIKGQVFSINIVERWDSVGLMYAWRRDHTVVAGQVGPVEADEGLRREAIRRAAAAAGISPEIAGWAATERAYVGRTWFPIGIAADAALVMIVVVFAYSLAWVPGWVGRRVKTREGVCGWCGYQKGTEGVCPECGRAYGG